MASVEDRIKKVTSKVLGVDPAEIKPEHHFAFDLGAEIAWSQGVASLITRFRPHSPLP